MGLIPTNMRTADLTGRDNLFVDVDGTLLIWSGDHPGRAVKFPNEQIDYTQATINVDLVHELRVWIEGDLNNRRLYIWSVRDIPHCEKARALCGLQMYPTVEVIPKPGAMIDDSYKWLDRIGRTKIK